MFLWVFGSGILIASASLIGLLFRSGKIGYWIQDNLRFLVSFSIGVFIVITYGLIDESLHEGTPILIFIPCLIAGGLFIEYGSKLIKGAHHHHDLDSDHSHTKIDANKMLMSDAIHNFGDGIILVPAYLVDIRLGIGTTVGIFIHEVVQEISEFFVLKEAGYSTKEAVLRNVFVSAAIFIGIILSFTLSKSASLIPALSAFAGGGFATLILRDLAPSTLFSIRKKGGKYKHILAFIVGSILMMVIQNFFSH